MLNLLLLSLAILLHSDVQAQFGGCFSSSGCTGVISAVSAEDCCVNNPSGLYFTNGGQCFQCIVYGWGTSSITRPESQTPHQVPLAYFKGPAGVSLIVDIIDVIQAEGGTASRDDYTENENNQIFVPLNPARTTSVTFRPDNIPLEPDETIVFDLLLLAASPGGTAQFDPALPNVFFQRRIVLSIQDRTKFVFRLRDLVREEYEDNGHIEVRVGVEYPLYLASPISLLLTPKVAPVDFTPKPDTVPHARANTHPDRLDFSPEPIKLTFPVGRTRSMVAYIPIIDDNINEALEYFIVELSFADPVSVPDTVSIAKGRNIMRCDIYDNDYIFIGFLLPDTTYREVEATHDVTLIKGAGNVTEQEILVIVSLIETVPPGTSFDTATPSDENNDNDLAFGKDGTSKFVSFLPDVNQITVNIIIFNDKRPESTEAAQLILDVPPRFEILPEFQNFFIIIEDDDIYRIGFETLSYTVSEGVGSQQVCVRMFEPPEDVAITGIFLVAVETVPDTADESDYTAESGFSTIVTFNNVQRRSCVDIMIIDDNVYENEEYFFLRLAELPGFGLPSDVVMDPDKSKFKLTDNEMVTVGFIDPPYSAREDEGVMIFTVGVTSGHTLDRDIELSFSTDDIDVGALFATAGVDYTAIIDKQFILNKSKLSFQIGVVLIHNEVFEFNKTFRGKLALLNGERMTIDVSSAVATIIDDKSPSAPLNVRWRCYPGYPSFVIRWDSPSIFFGNITKYELKIEIPEIEDLAAFKKDLFYLLSPKKLGSSQVNVTVQVRAHSSASTGNEVGRWSPTVPLDCMLVSGQ